MFDGSPFLKVFISSQIIEVGYDVIKAIGQYLELRIICLYFLDFESDHCFGIWLVCPPYANVPVGPDYRWKWEEGVGCSFLRAFFNYAFEIIKFS